MHADLHIEWLIFAKGGLMNLHKLSIQVSLRNPQELAWAETFRQSVNVVQIKGPCHLMILFVVEID